MYERSLDTELQYLKGVGPRAATALAKAGLKTVGDMLYYLPRRYEDRRHLPPIAQLRPGEFATIKGRVIHVDSRSTKGGKVMLKALVRDATGAINLTWFNQPWIKRTLDDYRGEIIAYGAIKNNGYSTEMASPEWEILDEDSDPDEFTRIVPVYPLVEGLNQKLTRKAAKSAIDNYLSCVKDPLPEFLRQQVGLNDLQWCLREIHSPSSEQNRLEARKRLVFEDFFYLQASLAMKRAESQLDIGISFPVTQLVKQGILTGTPEPEKGKRAKAALERAKKALPDAHLFAGENAAERDSEKLWDQIRRLLPFELTNAQKRVVQEIWADMERPHPMNRLLQGDVGSGKTAVAACAILVAVRSGYQAAIMAPTEILAEQHYASLTKLFEPLGIEVELLVGKQTASQKKRAYERTASGYAHLAIGTHALIQEGVAFANLGLVVVDEQHRFGVLQRKALRDKGFGNPDVLVMTATPIPRTLTMTMFGDLDLSVIDELPPGRKPIKTHWKFPFERQAVYDQVRKLVESGKQAYFVCPMVSENETMMAQAAEELYDRLKSETFVGFRVGLLHGQMRPKDKEEVMELFRRHEMDVLVSTTVIEVGVDVPNASVMVIEDANRFGLSQLHQLRGRVGRGSSQSYCILIGDAKSDEAQARLDIMVSTNDGFKIAEEDLKLRGPGEMAGTRQSGNLDFKIADLVQDGKMLEVARQAALEVVAQNPNLSGTEWDLALSRVMERRSAEAVISIS